MNHSTILKVVNLAVCILATGVGPQSHTSAFANRKDIQVINTQTKALKDDYSKPYFEYRNVTGYIGENNKLDAVTNQGDSVLVSLDGNDLSKWLI